MLNQELLAAYYADALAPAERAQVERQLATDQASQRALAYQQLMDQALRVVLGGPEADQRVKHSVLAVVRATSLEQLRAQVLAETSRRQTETTPHAAKPATSASHGVANTPRRASWQTMRARVTAAFHFQFSTAQRFAAAAALLAVGLGLYLYSAGQKPANQTDIGQFAVVIGTPTIRRPGEQAAFEARRTTPVRLGDHIETSDADRAEIQFRDGTTLRMHFNTVLELPTLNSELRTPKVSLLRPPEISLLRGQVWTKVQKTTNSPRYAIRTPVATAVAKGTEFGLKLQRTRENTNSQSATRTAQSAVPLLAVLTVKEGTVDFFNSFGSVQATAMTESTAHADARPTEPKRLQTLKGARDDDSRAWALMTSPLTWPEAAVKLATGGGWTGLKVRDFASSVPKPNTIVAAATSEVRVVQVTRPSPADSARLQTGDVLLAINGQPVTAATQVEKAILIRPNAEAMLSLRRGGEERTVVLTATNQASILPGPALRLELLAQLADLTRRLVEEDSGQRQQTIQRLQDGPLRGAAENNLGVILEIEEALGPAIRAYGRAMHADPQVPLYHFNLGLALRKIGSFERAAEELETAWRLAPQSTRARQRFAEIQSLLGRDREALALTDAALQENPQAHGLWELKAQLLLKQFRLEEAYVAVLKAIELDPDCAVARGYLGAVLQEQKQLDAAEAAYRKAIELDPFNALLHLNLGTVQQDRKQLLPAELSFRKAIELRPDFALAYLHLGNVLADGREFAQATIALQKGLELDPDDVSAHRRLGNLALKQQQLDEAEKQYSKVLELSPDDPESYYGLGEVYRTRRQFSAAEKMFRKAIQLSPKGADSYSGLGLLLAERGDLAEAERLLRKARDLDPDSSSMNNNLGEVLRRSGRFDEADQCYRQALKLDPNNLGAYSNLGIIHALRREFEEAEKIYRTLLERAPASAKRSAYVNLANVCGEQGKLEEAEKLFRQALAMSPDEPAICNSLAWFLADHRLKLDEALTLSRRAVQATPNDPNQLDTLGWVHFQRGELVEAENTLKKALELAGDNPPASEIREHLKKVGEKKGTPSK